MSMPSRLIISNFRTGLEKDREPFIIDNDAFPFLENAYIWRGRIQKKRGTDKLGRLERCLTAVSGSTVTFPPNTFNIFTLLGLLVSEPNAQVVPGTVADPIIIVIGAQTLTDSTGTGTFVVAPAGIIVSATINYATGVVTVVAAPAGPLPVTITVCYYPGLPVMGIETFENVNTNLINSPTIFLDTRYSYQFALPVGQRFFYDVSFYKITGNPITWHGTDAQQFWSANFDNALFVTQNVPGLNGVQVSGITNVINPVVTTVTNHGLDLTNTIQDFIFFAGVSGFYNPNSSPPNISYINGATLQIGVATTINVGGGPQLVTAMVTGLNTIQLNGLNPAGSPSAGLNGFMQELTRQTGTQDGIHWYDGDPTTSGFAKGWVNFAPPINQTDPTNPTDIVTFMVGALLLAPFAGSFLALGVWEQAANSLVPQYFAQRIRWCTISGTPFYAPPVPTEETFDALNWVSNINGRGGFLDIITAEEIISVNIQQESLIIGMERTQRRLAASGSVINPFIPYIVNPEYGTQSTFSTVALDRGVLSVGDYGFILTTSYNAQRFDLKIPDQAFQFKQFITNVANGPDRVCSIRNWQEETIHFTYVDLLNGNIYPNRTVFFNYRDPSFAILRESYTTYGQFRDQLPFDWIGVGIKFGDWLGWLPNWFSFEVVPGYPSSAGGNQQGYVMLKVFENTRTDFSLSITAIGATVGEKTSLTVINHNLEEGDFIYIDRALGTGLAGVNKKIAKVLDATNQNVIVVDGLVFSGTYIGSGEITVLDNFFVQTKEFAQFWQQAHGLRLGTQRFLLDNTSTGEFTCSLYVSQNITQAANNPLFGEEPWIVSNDIVRTKPDNDLGIYGSRENQEQIWHRLSNSVLGDGVQMGFFLSETQMRMKDTTNLVPTVAFDDWVLHSIVIDIYGSRTLI